MLKLTINGKEHQVDAPGDMPLLWVLRDLVGLKGTKYGCGIAQCGACTVHIDGVEQRSCVLPVSAVQGKSIVTIEALDDEVGRAVKAAWEKLAVPQCGFCQSGQVMAATSLLRRNPKPTDQEIATGMNGIVCRCCTYQRVKQAVREAADNLA